MSRIRQTEEQKKGRQISLGKTSNEKSMLMMKGNKYGTKKGYVKKNN